MSGDQGAEGGGRVTESHLDPNAINFSATRILADAAALNQPKSRHHSAGRKWARAKS